MLTTCLPSGNLEFLQMLSRGCLHDQSPTKTLGTDSLMSFLGRWYFMHIVTTYIKEELSASCVIPVGQVSWKLAPGFLWTLFHEPFPLLMCFSSFDVINHSHEYSYIVSPVSLPSESWTWGVRLRGSWQRKLLSFNYHYFVHAVYFFPSVAFRIFSL